MTPPNHFELFDLPQRFELDLEQLNRRYRRIQAEVHPDRFAAAPAAERLRSMQLATRVNEAYQTLKHPTARARYLLQLQGVDTQEESNTAMPADFLMLQMEWRETMEDAVRNSDIDALDGLLREMCNAARTLEQELLQQLDRDMALEQAAGTVRKLSFIDKARADVEQAIVRLEDA
ncbi:MAG TPA: Fe-S protein assembly co-chaperone HscB [Methylophilaceae bacterium]|jgi:molecular chaperone HscB